MITGRTDIGIIVPIGIGTMPTSIIKTGDLVMCFSGAPMALILGGPQIEWGHAYFRVLGSDGKIKRMREDEFRPLEPREPVSWIRRRLMQSNDPGHTGS